MKYLIIITLLLLIFSCSKNGEESLKNNKIKVISNTQDTSKNPKITKRLQNNSKMTSVPIPYKTIGYGQIIIKKDSMFQPRFEIISNKTSLKLFLGKVVKKEEKKSDFYKPIDLNDKIDFSKEMVVVVYRYNGIIRPEFQKFILNDKSLTGYVKYKVPKGGIMPMSSNNIIWTYEAVVIKKMSVSFKIKIKRTEQ